MLGVKRDLLGIGLSSSIFVVLYLLYLYYLSQITGAQLSSFGSSLQVGTSLLYILAIFTLVVVIMQIIILGLKQLAKFLKLDS